MAAAPFWLPSSQVYEVRLRLASQGLPKGSVVGFELMENQKLGTSQFHEQVNYQRALEGELTRSIQSLSAVQGARVHLAIPSPSVFTRDQQKPSASVLVSLYPGPGAGGPGQRYRASGLQQRAGVDGKECDRGRSDRQSAEFWGEGKKAQAGLDPIS